LFASGQRLCTVAVQTDGRIVAVGPAGIGGVLQFALTRYDVTGNLDASFGHQGKVVTGLGTSSDEWAQGIAIQDGGKLAVAGGTASPMNFVLARYTTNGTLDTGLGNGGKVTTDFGTPIEGASAMALQLDGRIVAAGYAYLDGRTSDFGLARYSVDGMPDTSFGSSASDQDASSCTAGPARLKASSRPHAASISISRGQRLRSTLKRRALSI
jgi:uncharacterized delta-60 repeat protein